MGEVSGYVFLKNEGKTRGQGRILINIFKENSEKVASVLTEGDGYFSYLGLATGSYTAKIDEQQLEKIKLHSSEAQPFDIEINKYGDIVDDLEFILQKNQ